MRLNQQQADTLKRIAAEEFGSDAQLWLFGSRTDDARRGGDIDLYVTGFNQPIEKILDAKLRFLVKAKLALGEQRIDVVIAQPPGQMPLSIHQMVEQTGIAL